MVYYTESYLWSWGNKLFPAPLGALDSRNKDVDYLMQVGYLQEMVI